MTDERFKELVKKFGRSIDGSTIESTIMYDEDLDCNYIYNISNAKDWYSFDVITAFTNEGNISLISKEDIPIAIMDIVVKRDIRVKMTYKINEDETFTLIDKHELFSSKCDIPNHIMKAKIDKSNNLNIDIENIETDWI